MPRQPTRVMLEAIADRSQKGAVPVDYERPFCCVVSRYLARLRGRKRSLIKFFARKSVRRISESRRSQRNLLTVSQQGAKKSLPQVPFDIFLRSSQGIWYSLFSLIFFSQLYSSKDPLQVHFRLLSKATRVSIFFKENLLCLEKSCIKKKTIIMALRCFIYCVLNYAPFSEISGMILK